MGLDSIQIAVTIDDIHTDFIFTLFNDCIFVVVTQREKIGHLIEAYSDGGFDECETYTVNVLLGSRESVEQIYARNIVQEMSKVTKNKVLIGMGLKDRQPPTSMLDGILSVIRANAVFWGKQSKAN